MPGYSAWSNTVTVQVVVSPPAPTNLVAKGFATNATQASVNLTWAEAPTATVTGFNIQLATNAAFTAGLKTVTASGFSQGVLVHCPLTAHEVLRPDPGSQWQHDLILGNGKRHHALMNTISGTRELIRPGNAGAAPPRPDMARRCGIRWPVRSS